MLASDFTLRIRPISSKVHHHTGPMNVQMNKSKDSKRLNFDVNLWFNSWLNDNGQILKLICKLILKLIAKKNEEDFWTLIFLPSIILYSLDIINTQSLLFSLYWSWYNIGAICITGRTLLGMVYFRRGESFQWSSRWTAQPWYKWRKILSIGQSSIRS